MLHSRTNLVGICLFLCLAAFVPASAIGQTAKGKSVRSTASNDTIRCCGLALRTDFGHPKRMEELRQKTNNVGANFYQTGKIDGFLDAYEEYLKQVDTEFGDAKNRDIMAVSLVEEIRLVQDDDVRLAKFCQGQQRMYFGLVMGLKGMHRRAIEILKESHATLKQALPPDSTSVTTVEELIALQQLETGDFKEATNIMLSVVKRARATYDAQDLRLAGRLMGLGKVQLESGEPALAEKSLREAYTISATALELQPRDYVLNCLYLAEAMLAQSKFQETAELMEYLEPRVHENTAQTSDPASIRAVTYRAKALVGLGNLDEAEKVLGEWPSTVQSLVRQDVHGRNLLDVYVTILEKTNREEQAAPINKRVIKMTDQIDSSKLR